MRSTGGTTGKIPELDGRLFLALRVALRRFAEARRADDEPVGMAEETTRQVGIVDRGQLAARRDCPATLTTLAGEDASAIAAAAAEAVGCSPACLEPGTIAVVVARWWEFEARFGHAADAVQIQDQLVRAAPTTLSAAQRELALAVMLTTSSPLSRAISYARPYSRQIILNCAADCRRWAEEGFARGARFVVEQASAAALPTCTSIRELNALLVYDQDPPTAGQLCSDAAEPLFVWLETPEAARMAACDPVALAEHVHYEVSARDAFVEGNGRTARLLADWILIRAGMAPVFYRGMRPYFERGSARAPCTREAKQRYFLRLVMRGQALRRRVLSELGYV